MVVTIKRTQQRVSFNTQTLTSPPPKQTPTAFYFRNVSRKKVREGKRS